MEIKLIKGHSLLRKRLLLIIMRTFIFLCCATVFALTPNNLVSQHSKVEIAADESLTVDEVFDLIMEQTEYKFFYEEGIFKDFPKVQVQKGRIRTNMLLKQSLANSNLNIEVTANNAILISEKSQNAIPEVKQNKELQDNISGTITDENNQPLPGANILEKGTTNGTQADFDGNFSIAVGEDAILVVSYIGFATKEVLLSGQTNIVVSMEEDAAGLDEVVVIGYGTQKKINVTGAVASLDSRDLEKVPPVASTTNALAGRLPGLISKQESGMPGGDAASLSIRGFGNALIIVDGVESEFNNIDVNSIESISILKDASAAIYGARAGNGVILITTKRGIEGKPQITLNSSYSLQSITNYPTMMSSGQWTELDREKRAQLGQQQRYTQEDVDLFYAGTNPDYPNTDWYDVMIKDSAPMQNHNLSVRGGSDKIKYYGLIGFMDQQLFWKTDGGDFKRFNLLSNIDAKITDNLSLQLDFSNINELSRYSARSSDGALWHDYWGTFPIYPASLPDPSKQPYTGTGKVNSSSSRSVYGYNDTDIHTIRISGGLKYNIPFVKGLSAKFLFTSLKIYNNNKKFMKPVTFWSYNYASDTYTNKGTWLGEAQLEQQNAGSQNLTTQLSLNYDKIIGNHNISALFLYESIDERYEYIQAKRYHFLTPAIDYLFAGSAADQYAYGSANEMGRTSYIGRLNYSFKSKYLFEATLRADASAKFPPEKRWGYFPSLSAGWRISEESFIRENISWLDNLKLRGGISKAGFDNVGNFAYLAGYKFGTKYNFDNRTQSGLNATGLSNPNLTWEEMTLYNIGLDFSINSRFYGEFDVFYRKREGIPATRFTSLPSTFGATLPPENLNSQNNRGFEAMIGTRGHKGSFSWDISANVSWSRSKWDHYEEPDYSDDPDQLRIYGRSGQWVDRLIGYRTNGLYTSQEEIDAMTFDQDQNGNITIQPGDLRFIDENKDGILNWRDLVEIGAGPIPHAMFGLTTTFNYKNFDFNALFQGAGDNDVTIMNPQMPLFDGEDEQISREMFLGRWTEENNDPYATFYRVGSAAAGGGDNHDYYLRKGGYIRLKNLNFGYTLPENLLDFLGSGRNTLRIYFGGTNLVTLDRLKEFKMDPEAPSDWLYYPQQRVFTLGTNLTF